ncbi:MAG: hypothetical protein R2879_20820 [Saprospiraceae bacterium]
MSKVGVQISALPHKQKILAIIKCILENEVFHQVLSLHLEKLEPIEKIEIEHLLRKSKSMRYNSDSTILRRSQTVLKRVEWILEQVE